MALNLHPVPDAPPSFRVLDPSPVAVSALEEFRLSPPLDVPGVGKVIHTWAFSISLVKLIDLMFPDGEPDYETSGRHLMAWCEKWKVHYYAAPDETYDLNEAIRGYYAAGADYLLLEGLS